MQGWWPSLEPIPRVPLRVQTIIRHGLTPDERLARDKAKALKLIEASEIYLKELDVITFLFSLLHILFYLLRSSSACHTCFFL